MTQTQTNKMHMKNIFFVLIFFASSFIFCQTKIAHINYSELLKSMPETLIAKTTLEMFTLEYQKQLDALQVDYNSKSEIYKKEEASMLPALKSLKFKELQDLEASFVKFKEAAQLEINAKESQLSAPILKKAKDAVEVIVKKKGYSYVIDSSVGQYVYLDPKENIMDLVKSELGIK